jgi:PP-loop superfamily ATP-utilizing enzyme
MGVGAKEGFTDMSLTSLHSEDRRAVEGLRAALRGTARPGVAFSGGVDSSVVLRRIGLGDLRVRHHGEVARLEVPAEDLPALATSPLRDDAIRVVWAAGFRFVTVDLAGIQSGAFPLPLVSVREG